MDDVTRPLIEKALADVERQLADKAYLNENQPENQQESVVSHLVAQTQGTFFFKLAKKTQLMILYRFPSD